MLPRVKKPALSDKPRKELRGTRLKLYLNQDQEARLIQQTGNARFVWNHSLKLWKRHYRMFGKCKGFKPLGWVRLSRHLTGLKDRKDFLGLSFRYNLNEKLRDLDKSMWQAIKSKGREKGFPRFKKKASTQSLRYDRRHFWISGNHLWLPKIGEVRFRGRLLEGEVRQMTVSRTIFGRVTASVVYEKKPEARRVVEAVGVDMNCHRVVLSNGTEFKWSGYFFEDKIKYWSRVLSRRQKGSRRRFKARQMLAKWHSKALSKRNYLTHILTSRIAYPGESKARLVVLEDLALGNLTRKGKGKRGLNRSLLDSCLGRIKEQLKYKTATLVADRFYASSKLCSFCGERNAALGPGERRWTCSACGVEHDRDLNAARNLLGLLEGLRNSPRGGEVRLEGLSLPAGVSLRSEEVCLSPPL